jgi:prepilin-type N-terminal cleavage/methylation domain-containing protein
MSDRAARLGSARSGGFTLIESIVALVVVSAVLLILAPVLFHVANQRVEDEGVIEREALLRGEASRLSILPFANLDAEAGCTTVSVVNAARDLAHTRCIGVTAVSSGERTVTVKITPANTRVAKDSVVFTRTKAKSNPFNTASP